MLNYCYGFKCFDLQSSIFETKQIPFLTEIKKPHFEGPIKMIIRQINVLFCKNIKSKRSLQSQSIKQQGISSNSVLVENNNIS